MSQKTYNDFISFMKVAASDIGLKTVKYLLRHEHGAKPEKIYKAVGGSAPRRFEKTLGKLRKCGLIMPADRNKLCLTAAGEAWPGLYERYTDLIEIAGKGKSFGSEAKQLALEEYGRFLAENLEVPPDSAVVLGLPGADFHEGKIYREVGIRESNYYGVEDDNEVLRALQKKIDDGRLSIHLIRDDIKNYVSHIEPTKVGDVVISRGQFDIVFLDFDSYFQQEYLDTIEQLYRSAAIKDGGILALTYKRGRESCSKALIKDIAQRTTTFKMIFSGRADSIKAMDEKLKRLKDDEGYVPREDIDYFVGALDYIIKQGDALRELGLQPGSEGMQKAIEEHEDKLLQHLNDALLPVKMETVIFQTGSPMKMVFYKLKRQKYGSYFEATMDINRMMGESFPVHEIREKIKGRELVPRITLKPRPKADIPEDELKIIREKARRAKDGEYDSDQIAVEHNLSRQQVSSFMAWWSDSFQKRRKKF